MDIVRFDIQFLHPGIHQHSVHFIYIEFSDHYHYTETFVRLEKHQVLQLFYRCHYSVVFGN